MKKGPLLLCILCFSFAAAAQSSQAELEALQKKLKKQMDSVMNLPQVKNRAKNPNDVLTDAQKNTPKQVAAKEGKSNFDKTQLPPKDSLRLKNIPKKTFSPTELRSYMNDLYNKMAKNLPPAIVSQVNQTAAELNNDPAKMETAALLALKDTEAEIAALLVAKGGTMTSDGIFLTNAGAILDISGLSDKAIPILRSVVAHSPANFIAHNNLGQAYTALGQHDSALHYFSRCLSLSPQHPEANNTAGVIELKRGNESKAQAHFENSIRGGFNVSAYAGLKHILKDKTRIAHLVKPKIKMPEYFNQFKYKLPRQQENLADAADVEAEQKLFREVISNAISKYAVMQKEAEAINRKKDPMKMNAVIQAKAARGEPILRPFQVLGGIMESETMLLQQKDQRDLENFNKTNREQYKALEQQYKAKFDAIWKRYIDEDDDCCGEGNVSCCEDQSFCLETNALKKEYLPRFAQLNQEYQGRNLLIQIEHLDNMLYWSFFAAYDLDDYKVRFYGRVVDYLKTLQRLDIIKILKPCKEQEAEEKEKEEEKLLKDEECPSSLTMQLNLGIAKFSLDCQSYSFKAGKGVVLRYEKNLLTRQSTWSLGLGEEPFAKDMKYGGLDLKLHMSVFLTFDGAGNLYDGGLISEAKVSASYGFEGGDKLKFKDGIGWRLGVNSGLSLTPGRLKNLIDKIGPPPEQQVNKNIKIYKPNQ
jgi:tetratricopeptide (TPR) repeat protein